MRATITVFALLLAAAGAGCTIYPAEPASPTFTKDVQPILVAHCARCHGGGERRSPTRSTAHGAAPSTATSTRWPTESVIAPPASTAGWSRSPLQAGREVLRDSAACAGPGTSLFDVYVFRPPT